MCQCSECTFFTSFSHISSQVRIQQALELYIKKQHEHGHPDLLVSQCGFIINPMYSYLGALPDGAVYDPSNGDKAFGFLEIKCPYSVRHLTPAEATHTPGFCTALPMHSSWFFQVKPIERLILKCKIFLKPYNFLPIPTNKYYCT